jgi:small-conductance mechanosensitive channel
MGSFDSPWFMWSVAIAVGLPILLIGLTELRDLAVRRADGAGDRYRYARTLARQLSLLRNYVLPLGALLLLLVKAGEIPFGDTPVRILTTVLGLLLLVLVLSGLSGRLFEVAPETSWRRRVPGIFLDVIRFVIIGVGLAIMMSFIWGVRIGGLFTALGVTSVVIGLMLQNSVGQIVSGLFMLFEQPFRIGEWLDLGTAQGRVVEVNWRAVHIDTGGGLRITPNSVLATTPFTNLSRPPGTQKLTVTTTFSSADPPDRVCAMLSRVAGSLPQLATGSAARSVPVGGADYRTTIALNAPGDAGAAKATFLQWVWYAARRDGLHLDGADDEFSTAERVEHAVRTVVAPTLRLNVDDQRTLQSSSRIVRYGTGEVVERVGEVPDVMTFVVAGCVQVTATAADGSVVPINTLAEGAFLGLTALTRQPNLSSAYALDEVTALEIDREHLDRLVMNQPLLLQSFGSILDERRSTVRMIRQGERAG